jgi:hypothetical protein
MTQQSDSKTVDFRDESRVFLTRIKRPTFMYDKSSGIRHKYGEFEQVENIYKLWRKGYIDSGFNEIADDLAIVEVEPKQELIDELFQSSGRFEMFVREISKTDGKVH